MAEVTGPFTGAVFRCHACGVIFNRGDHQCPVCELAKAATQTAENAAGLARVSAGMQIDDSVPRGGDPSDAMTLDQLRDRERLLNGESEALPDPDEPIPSADLPTRVTGADEPEKPKAKRGRPKGTKNKESTRKNRKTGA